MSKPCIKERPILFSAPMIRAILDGTKTQTRRIVKGEALRWLEDGFTSEFVSDYQNNLCPYGKIGDRLWVRETFHTVDGHSAFYRADYEYNPQGDKDHGIVWKPSIHMPRWASRINLEITGVRVERLQGISEADAIAEGVEKTITGDGWRRYCADKELEACGLVPYLTAAGSYSHLWDSINGEGSFMANPWVWVVEFKALENG